MLRKNIFYLFIVQGGNYLIPLLTFPYLLRVLGPTSFGLLGFFQATIQYCILLIEYGFNWTATEAIAKNKKSKEKVTIIFWGVFWAKVFLASTSILLLLILIMVFDIYAQHFLVILAFIPLIVSNIIYPVWFFQGIEEMKWITICTLLAKLIIVPTTFIFVNNPNDIWVAAFIQSCSMMLSGLISVYIIMRKKWVSKIIFDYVYIRKCLSDGWHLFISTSAISLYTTSTTIILGAIAGPIAVGYYNTANTIRGAMQGLLNPIAQAIYPRISYLITEDYQSALFLIKRMLKYFCCIALLSSLSLFIYAAPIIKIVAGTGYDGAVTVLRWMSFIPFFVAMSNIFGVQTMLTHGYKKEFSFVLIISGVLNILLILPLVYFESQAGAAMALLLTEVFVTAMMYIFLRKKKIFLFKR
ncbi:flippase [Salmonella enterica]